MVATNVTGGQENRSGNVVALERRFGLVEVVGVTVVERDDHRAVREVTAKEEYLGETLESYRIGVPA
jgi:hypothetical protein